LLLVTKAIRLDTIKIIPRVRDTALTTTTTLIAFRLVKT